MFNYDNAASASEYGGYGSDSGYGYCTAGYVNASAVAFLALMMLLNIVQDIINSITAPIANTGRKKREESEIFQFISNGGLEAVKEGLPQIILALMVDLVEAPEHPHCIQRPLCEANSNLATRYGALGSVLASLASNVVGKAFTGFDIPRYQLALEAASQGRLGKDCEQLYHACSYGPNFTSQFSNLTSVQRVNLLEVKPEFKYAKDLSHLLSN